MLISDPGVRWCPAPDCSYAVIATGCGSCPKLKCERHGCDTYFCFNCKYYWHQNDTCDAESVPIITPSSISSSDDSQTEVPYSMEECFTNKVCLAAEVPYFNEHYYSTTVYQALVLVYSVEQNTIQAQLSYSLGIGVPASLAYIYGTTTKALISGSFGLKTSSEDDVGY